MKNEMRNVSNNISVYTSFAYPAAYFRVLIVLLLLGVNMLMRNLNWSGVICMLSSEG